MNENFFTDNYSLKNNQEFEKIIPLDYRNTFREDLPDFRNEPNLLDDNVTLNYAPGKQGDEYKKSFTNDTILDMQFKHRLTTGEFVDKENIHELGKIEEIKNHVPFNLFQEFKKKNDFKDSIENIIQPSILSGVFFSRKNINNIQTKIISGIKKILNTDIGYQSEEELQTIMRSIYLQFSKNSDCNIQNQIKQLNAEVLKYCIQNVYSNAKQYLKYLKDINENEDHDKFPEPIKTNISSTENKKSYRFDTLINIKYPYD